MSFKFDALITILNKVDRGGRVTMADLTEDLQVGERTIYRYIGALVNAGFPVYFDKKKGGYTFEEGYSLKKPHFTVEENLAFALAKKILHNYGPGMEKSLGSMEEKLSMKGAATKGIIIAPEETPDKVGAYLMQLHDAILNFKTVELVYRALHTDEVTSRKVDPYYVFFMDGFWHLRGFCRLRNGLRLFAIDRIVSLKVLDRHFLPRQVSPEDELAGTFGKYMDGDPMKVVVRVDKEFKAHLLRKKWHQSQAERELDDGRLEMTFEVNGMYGILEWTCRWIPFVEVVEPKELRAMVIDNLKKTLAKYGEAAGGSGPAHPVGGKPGKNPGRAR